MYATVLTEDLLNTSRRPQPPARKRPPHNLGWDERKRKEKAGWNLRPWEGAGRGVARTERELQRRVSQPVCDTETETELPSVPPACAPRPRRTSAGTAGAGCWNGFRAQSWGEGWGLATQRRPEKPSAVARWGVRARRSSLFRLRDQVPGGCPT